MFKIKDGNKLELQKPETTQFVGSTKKIKWQNNECTKSLSDWNSFVQQNLVDKVSYYILSPSINLMLIY